MENAGLVTYGQSVLLMDPKTASDDEKRRYVLTAGHELAHQWFGNLVTPVWWDDLWLNESFADWMGDKIADEVYPEYRLAMSEMGAVQEIMVGDARASAQPVRQPVRPGDNLMQKVGTQYNKGKGVLGMFEQWVGAENLRRGLLEYLRAHAWGNATADDLWAAIGGVSGADVAGAMATFLEQPGLPLVALEVSPVGGLRLNPMTVRHFLYLGDLSTAELRALLKRAIELKAMRRNGEVYEPLKGKVMGMVFEKSSTRTRVSFEAGMAQFGGHAIFLPPRDTQLVRGEPIEDTARVLSSMVDVVMIRTFEHDKIERFAKFSAVPVINGLTDDFHPCQLLADLATYIEQRGDITGKTVAWVGDGNNMSQSYINAAVLFDFKLNLYFFNNV